MVVRVVDAPAADPAELLLPAQAEGGRPAPDKPLRDAGPDAHVGGRRADGAGVPAARAAEDRVGDVPGRRGGWAPTDRRFAVRIEEHDQQDPDGVAERAAARPSVGELARPA